MKVIFFANGNTAFCDENGHQVPALQKSYMQLYCEFLVSKGVDPPEVEFSFPNGSKATAFLVGTPGEDRWNWEFKQQAKPAIDRLEEFEPYKDHCRRKKIVDEFFGEFKTTAATLPGPKENLCATLITFMEWLEMRKK